MGPSLNCDQSIVPMASEEGAAPPPLPDSSVDVAF